MNIDRELGDCFLCNTKFNPNGSVLLLEHKLSNGQPVTEILSKILHKPVLHSTDNFGQIVCEKCIENCEAYQKMETQVEQLKSQMLSNYNRAGKHNVEDPVTAISEKWVDDSKTTFVEIIQSTHSDNDDRIESFQSNFIESEQTDDGEFAEDPDGLQLILQTDQSLDEEHLDEYYDQPVRLNFIDLPNRLKFDRDREVDDNQMDQIIEEESEFDESVNCLEENELKMEGKEQSISSDGTTIENHNEYIKLTLKSDGGITNKVWACTICSKSYLSRAVLAEHVNTHTGKRPFKCPECSKDFASKYTMTAHMKIHTERHRPFQCDKCDKTFLSNTNLRQHSRTHTDVKKYICGDCGKAFGTVHNLEVHKIVHSGHKPFECQTCGKSFARRAEIRDHERIHTGEKPHACDFCSARFTQRSNLLSHKRATHFDDRRYKCDTCGRSFKRRRLLDYHIQSTHTGVRPYQCTVCSSSFVYPEHFKKHMRIHTGDKPFDCEVCGKSFNSRDNRNAHRYVHSEKKPYECMVCGQGYMRKPLLYAHMHAQNHLNDTIVINQPQILSVVDGDSDERETANEEQSGGEGNHIDSETITDDLSESISTSNEQNDQSESDLYFANNAQSDIDENFEEKDEKTFEVSFMTIDESEDIIFDTTATLPNLKGINREGIIDGLALEQSDKRITFADAGTKVLLTEESQVLNSDEMIVKVVRIKSKKNHLVKQS